MYDLLNYDILNHHLLNYDLVYYDLLFRSLQNNTLVNDIFWCNNNKASKRLIYSTYPGCSVTILGKL